MKTQPCVARSKGTYMTDVDKVNSSADRTESKVREWALKRNGDPVTPHDVIELVLAVDDDSCERSRRLEKKLDAHIQANTEALKTIVDHLESENAELQDRFLKHLDDFEDHMEWTDAEPLPRLAKLEKRVDFLFAPRRAEDPAASDFTEQRGDIVCASSEELLLSAAEKKKLEGVQNVGGSNVFAREIQDMTTTWRVVRWLVVIAAGAMIVWGMTYWADSCASQKAEQGADHIDAPVLTSPSPN